jgi:hypothetical protein
MKTVVYHGRKDVTVEDVPPETIERRGLAS